MIEVGMSSCKILKPYESLFLEPTQPFHLFTSHLSVRSPTLGICAVAIRELFSSSILKVVSCFGELYSTLGAEETPKGEILGLKDMAAFL